MAKEKKLEHIQVKDNGIKLSNKVGDVLSDLKATLDATIRADLIKGIDKPLTWAIRQNILIRDFKNQSSALIKESNKEIKNDLKNDKTVNLTNKQALVISKQIDDGVLRLGNSAIKAYQDIVRQTQMTLRVNKAIELKDALSKHLESGLNIDVVYANGKTYKFDSYWEMKARTEIQKDIGSNMISAGKEAGVIFYSSAYFGDCAKDHAELNGKIFCDKEWESMCPKDRLDEVRNYIESHKIMTVQEAMDAPYYYTTRPNCRHYFSYIDIDSVLGAKTKDDLNKLRNERGLNFNGKYQPEKYEALKQQRLNEREIRATKEEVAKQEIELALHPGDKEIQLKILNGERRIDYYQAKQRKLEKEYSNIVRNYKREQVGVRADLGADDITEVVIKNPKELITVHFNANTKVTFSREELNYFKKSGRYDNISKGYDVLQPINRNFELPKELKNKGFKGEIIARQPTKYREGTLEHIYNSHYDEIKQDHLYAEKIKATINSYDNIKQGKTDNRFELDKFIETKPNKKGKIYDYWFKVVIEKENDSDYFTIVTAHPHKIKHK